MPVRFSAIFTAVFIAMFTALSLPGCGGDFNDDYNLLTELRLIAASAEPPEAAPGQSISLTAFAFLPQSASSGTDSGTRSIDIQWAACILPSLPGTGTINEECITTGEAPYLIPLGAGPALIATVPLIPDLTPDALGSPDATGGLYLPLRIRLRSPDGASVDGIYRLRFSGGSPPNQNPRLDSINLVTAGVLSPLIESVPIPVHRGDKLQLRALFTKDSTESYTVNLDDNVPRTVTEILAASWFSTAGTFSSGSTGDAIDTTLTLDKHLPPANSPIDLYIVGRDERGGLTETHRALLFQ